MADRRTIGRVQHKIDTSANWALATTFIPLAGEVIVYSDAPAAGVKTNKIKIGDGVTTVVNLPFTASREKVKVADTLEASHWSGTTYSFETEYPSSIYNLEVEISPNATVAQYKAYGKCGLAGNASTNVLKAINAAPTIDIPIILTYEVK